MDRAAPQLRRAEWALIGAFGCLAGLALTWIAAFRIGAIQELDGRTLQSFTGLVEWPRRSDAPQLLTSMADPRPFALLSVAVIALALARGRPRLALAAAAVLVGANVTTQALKPLFTESRPYDFVPFSGGPRDWPSGHTTGAMSLALALVIVAPSRLRPAAAVAGGAWAVGVIYGILMLGWHYPSDVLGAMFVAGGWSLLAVAALYAAEHVRPEAARKASAYPLLRGRHVTSGPALLAAGAALVYALAIARDIDGKLDYVQQHEAFLAAALLIGAAGLVPAATVAAILRR